MSEEKEGYVEPVLSELEKVANAAVENKMTYGKYVEKIEKERKAERVIRRKEIRADAPEEIEPGTTNRENREWMQRFREQWRELRRRLRRRLRR